jgi:hypothetical protein
MQAYLQRERHHCSVDLAPLPPHDPSSTTAGGLRLLLLGGSEPEAAVLQLAQQARGSAGAAMLVPPYSWASSIFQAHHAVVLGLAPSKDSLAVESSHHTNQLLIRLLEAFVAAACGVATAAGRAGSNGARRMSMFGSGLSLQLGSAPGCDTDCPPVPDRNVLAERLAQQVAEARAEAGALHAHYATLLDDVGGAQWRQGTAAMDRREPVGATGSTGQGNGSKERGGKNCAAAVQHKKPDLSEQCQKQQAQAKGSQEAAPVPTLAGKPSFVLAATASQQDAAAAASAHAREAQHALFEGQLEAAWCSQRKAEERVSGIWQRCASEALSRQSSREPKQHYLKDALAKAHMHLSTASQPARLERLQPCNPHVSVSYVRGQAPTLPTAGLLLPVPRNPRSPFLRATWLPCMRGTCRGRARCGHRQAGAVSKDGRQGGVLT